MKKSQQNFREKLSPSIQDKLVFPDEEKEYVYLFPKSKDFIEKFVEKKDFGSFEGYYYPVCIGDTYGLQIDCSLDNQTQAQSPEVLRKIKTIIEEKLQGKIGTIGQSWLISGWLSEREINQKEDIAKACYQALMPDSKWQQDKDGEGYVLGAKFFILSRDERYVVIILYPNEKTLKLSADFVNDWMRLFYYYHKIIWAYRNSRELRHSLKAYFAQVQVESKKLQKNLAARKQFKKFPASLTITQDRLKQYTAELAMLELQKVTIEINLISYQERSKRIQKESAVKTQNKTDLECLNNFSNLVNKKYLLQIQKDKEYLERGLKFLEDEINHVRSRLEIEKAERDRNFQELVTVAGAGIATVSLIKDPAKDFCSKDIKDIIFPTIPYFCDSPFSFSLVAGVIVSLVVWLVRKRLL